jgi:hypothetical protein
VRLSARHVCPRGCRDFTAVGTVGDGFLQRMMYEYYSLNTTNPAGIAGHAGNEILVSERSSKGLDTTRSV